MILANSSCKMLQIAIAQVQIHDGPPSDAEDPRGRIETYGKICRNCIQFWSSLSQFQHPWLRHRIEAIWSPNLITWQICFLAWRLGTNLLLGTVRRGRRSLIEFWASICRVPEGSRGHSGIMRHVKCTCLEAGDFVPARGLAFHTLRSDAWHCGADMCFCLGFEVDQCSLVFLRFRTHTLGLST